MLEKEKMVKEVNECEGEIWKEHPLGKFVSNLGRMKFLYKTRRQMIETKRITLGNVTKTGYRKTDIRGKKLYVHRLVLEAFTSVEEGIGKLVDHIDRNPLNNRLENLRWVTPQENARNRKKPEKFKHCRSCSCFE